MAGKWVKRSAWVLAGVAGLVAVGGLAGYLIMSASKAQLEGTITSDVLTAAVTVERDYQGIPVITGEDRADVAYATGYVHAQERFFQMDLLRRSAAGELAALVGEKALPLDRSIRLHRLRIRAQMVISGLEPLERRTMGAYVMGVNDGLKALKGRPFEYAMLNAEPETWTLEDSILTTFAMYLDLQDEKAEIDNKRGMMRALLGKDYADFLYPATSEWDAPIDGGKGVAVPLPNGNAAIEKVAQLKDEPLVIGSNNWAVSGKVSKTGSAIVADDMHLMIRVPNIWYRARLKTVGANPVDVTGVTLPGTPLVIVGSNGHVAWGFTNSGIDTSDRVIIEWADEKARSYKTRKGPFDMVVSEERICVKGGECEVLNVEETIWGPLLPEKDWKGRSIAIKWVAHDKAGVNVGMIEMETARSVRDAVAIGHRAGIPTQNLTVGDKAGNIAWTLAGPVPERQGYDGSEPVSFADGTKGWARMMRVQDIPVVMNPAGNRLWTANNRVVSGASLARLGDGGYDLGARAGRIRDRLQARDRFAETDLLSIQLDNRSPVMDRWYGLLKSEAKGDAELAAALKDWSGYADPALTSYRLVRAYRRQMINATMASFTSPMKKYLGEDKFPWIHPLSEDPVWAIAKDQSSRAAQLRKAAMDGLKAEVDDAGGYTKFKWAGATLTQIHHPLAEAIPLLGIITDPKQYSLPGDMSHLPRINGGKFGSSQRMAVSPGHEAAGIMHMPTGQAGNPLMPYYNKGHEDWVNGRASPFLPGKPVWILNFEPG